MGRPGNCRYPRFAVSPFSLISLVIVCMYLSCGRPLGLTTFNSMSSTVLVIWLSYLRLCQRRPFCFRCVYIGWTVAALLSASFRMWDLRLTFRIHRNILISELFISLSSFFFVVQYSATLCHSRVYDSFVDVMLELDEYLLVTGDSYPFVPC